MELIGDGDPQTAGYVPADFTNNSTAANGVVIGNNHYLVADTITNAAEQHSPAMVVSKVEQLSSTTGRSIAMSRRVF